MKESAGYSIRLGKADSASLRNQWDWRCVSAPMRNSRRVYRSLRLFVNEWDRSASDLVCVWKVGSARKRGYGLRERIADCGLQSRSPHPSISSLFDMYNMCVLSVEVTERNSQRRWSIREITYNRHIWCHISRSDGCFPDFQPPLRDSSDDHHSTGERKRLDLIR